MNDKPETPPDAPTEEPQELVAAEQVPMSPKELEKILDQHRIWVETAGEEDGKRAVLDGANLQGVNLQEALLAGAKLKNANLTGANLQDANLEGTFLVSANLQGAILFRANLIDANLQRTNFERANLEWAHLEGAKLQGAMLDANLQGANFEGANLEGASFSAYLKGPSHEGASLSPDLKGANFCGANLQRVYLSHANLHRALLAQANLQDANLNYANLQDAYLEGAKLQGASLEGAKLQGASLWDADLQAANLRFTNFERRQVEEDGEPGKELPAANLSRTNLRDTDLSDAKLSDVTGLQSHQLAGANLSNAKLPSDIESFKGLDHVEEISRHARAIFLGLIGGCVFSWLTIATTTDAALLTSSASTPLPIIQTKVPIAGFYWAAPVILLALYFYLHFYLQSLWEGLASLPARFPDGRTLDQRAYPWLLTSLVRAHVPLLTKDRPAYSRAKVGFSIVAAWYLVPATLVLFWFRYLPRHEWFGTGLLSAAVLVAIWSGVVFYQRAAATLRADPEDGPAITPGPATPVTLQAALIGAAIVVVIMTGQNRSDLNFFGYPLYADLQNAELSTKPPNWTGIGGKEEIDAQIAQVKPANLEDANLRFARANGAFLLKANLRRAKLRAADLIRANLRGADLLGANLQGAKLVSADLQGANLSFANLHGARLVDAKLQGTNLYGANLQGASFWPEGTNLDYPVEVACQQLSQAKNWQAAYRNEIMACGAPIPEPLAAKPATR